MVLCTPLPCAHCLRSSPLPRRLADARGQPVGPNRVWLADAWIPGLAMSRAIGDIVAHTVGVSSGEVGVAGWWDLVWTQQMGAMVAWAGAQHGTTDPGLHKPCHGAEPETSAVELCPQDKWLVLATDGVWEFIDPQASSLGCGAAAAFWLCQQHWLWSQRSLVVELLLQAVERQLCLCPLTSPAVLHHTSSCFACSLRSGQLQLRTLTRSPATGPCRRRLTLWAGARTQRRRAARCAHACSWMRTPACRPAEQRSALHGSIGLF